MITNVFWFCLMSLLTICNIYTGHTVAAAVSFLAALTWLLVIFNDRGGRCA